MMVHPQYRRQGIGQALLEKRLQNLVENGYPSVTTTILASNEASSGNVSKQGLRFLTGSVFGKVFCFTAMDAGIHER